VVQTGVLFDFVRPEGMRARSYPQGFPQNV
jgi:hypothetical protein